MNEGLSLDGDTVPAQKFSMKILRQKGLDIHDDKLCFAGQTPAKKAPAPATKKRKVEETSTTTDLTPLLSKIEKQDETLSQLVSLVHGLTTSFTERQGSLEEKLNETRVWVAKLKAGGTAEQVVIGTGQKVETTPTVQATVAATAGQTSTAATSHRYEVKGSVGKQSEDNKEIDLEESTNSSADGSQEEEEEDDVEDEDGDADDPDAFEDEMEDEEDDDDE